MDVSGHTKGGRGALGVAVQRVVIRRAAWGCGAGGAGGAGCWCDQNSASAAALDVDLGAAPRRDTETRKESVGE